MSNRIPMHLAFVAAVVLMATPQTALAQLDQAGSWAAFVANEYRVEPNVTYLVANDRKNKVDLYVPENAGGPTPVLMYIHGGGWRQGSKESSMCSGCCRASRWGGLWSTCNTG